MDNTMTVVYCILGVAQSLLGQRTDYISAAVGSTPSRSMYPSPKGLVLFCFWATLIKALRQQPEAVPLNLTPACFLLSGYGFAPHMSGVLRVFLLLIPRRAMHPKAGINTGLPIDFYRSYLPPRTTL